MRWERRNIEIRDKTNFHSERTKKWEKEWKTMMMFAFGYFQTKMAWELEKRTAN